MTLSTTTTVSVQSPDASFEEKEMMERMRIAINKAITRNISQAVEKDPSLDIESLLKDAIQAYTRRIANAKESYRKGISKKQREAMDPKEKKHVSRHEVSDGPVDVLWPLSPLVITALNGSDGGSEDLLVLLRPRLASLIDGGRCIHALSSRYIVQLADNIIVKISPVTHTPIGESDLLQYLLEHTSIPLPTPLGHIAVGDQSYLFLTYIPGDTLESKWRQMSTEQKTAISNSLDIILRQIREVPRPMGSPFGTLSTPHVCKHLVQSLSTSKQTIQTTSSFHDFLFQEAYPRISSGYLKWLRSLIKDDYQVVLTHGDFHAGNIIVVDERGCGDFKIAGIIDWEMGGWYPEYWEMYKAFNTRTAIDHSDWWDNLPKSIMGYDQEIIVLRSIERVMKI